MFFAEIIRLSKDGRLLIISILTNLHVTHSTPQAMIFNQSDIIYDTLLRTFHLWEEMKREVFRSQEDWSTQEFYANFNFEPSERLMLKHQLRLALEWVHKIAIMMCTLGHNLILLGVSKWQNWDCQNRFVPGDSFDRNFIIVSLIGCNLVHSLKQRRLLLTLCTVHYPCQADPQEVSYT